MSKDQQSESRSTTARRFLKAARKVVIRAGYPALTTKAVADECGLRSSLIHYHFGGKSGMVSALIDQVIRESSGTSNRREADSGVEGLDRVEALLQDQQRVSGDRQDYRLFLELLPSVLRDKGHRSEMAQGYQAYRDHDTEIVRPVAGDVDDVTLNRLVTLSIALVDGLAIQNALDPEHFDHAGAYTLWREMFVRALDCDAERLRDKTAAMATETE